MSKKVYNTVLKSEAGGSNTTARFILILLAHMANKDGYCYPSKKYLAQKANCGEITIYRALKRLNAENSLLTVRELGCPDKIHYVVLAGIDSERYGEVLKKYFGSQSKSMMTAIAVGAPLKFSIENRA